MLVYDHSYMCRVQEVIFTDSLVSPNTCNNNSSNQIQRDWLIYRSNKNTLTIWLVLHNKSLRVIRYLHICLGFLVAVNILNETAQQIWSYSLSCQKRTVLPMAMVRRNQRLAWLHLSGLQVPATGASQRARTTRFSSPQRQGPLHVNPESRGPHVRA